MKLNMAIVEDYLNCKYKAHLSLHGQADSAPGEPEESPGDRGAFLAAAKSALLSHLGEAAAPSGAQFGIISATAPPPILLDTIAEVGQNSFQFQGLIRVEGDSGLGPFHYVPVVFSERDSVNGKYALALAATFLGQVQGRVPAKGVAVYGSPPKVRAMDLTGLQARSEAILTELVAMGEGKTSPALVLNKHCSACRFQVSCRESAVAKDDLSLLRGITEQQVQKYHRKGIFTVQQLSYTLRRRRRSKRVKAKRWPHSFELQALALREKRVYVFSKPSLPPAAAQQVFIDMKGMPTVGASI
jgi:predicted RecB family nuclease